MTRLMLISMMLAAIGQTTPPVAKPDGKVIAAAKAPEGLWPSEKLLGLLLARVADQVTDRYGLPEDRRGDVREAFVNRWSGFLNDHRGQIQPLANEFLEMRLGLTPPDKTRVQEWAERTGPLFDEIKRQVRDSRMAVGETLEPGERTKFAAESMAMEVGLQFVEMKLSEYASGHFDEVDFWQPYGMDREAKQELRDNRRTKRRAAVAEIRRTQPPVDQVGIELSLWEVFTVDFIRIYDLDEGQRSAARSCLSELSERARSHRDRYRDEILRLERQIAGEKSTESELVEIQEKLVSLYGPIDEMFSELKNRLGRIPTSHQRARVSEVQGGNK